MAYQGSTWGIVSKAGALGLRWENDLPERRRKLKEKWKKRLRNHVLGDIIPVERIRITASPPLESQGEKAEPVKNVIVGV